MVPPPPAMPCLVLPSPFDLLRVGDARSLTRWTSSRRERFTEFLYENRHSLEFDRKCLELFFNELYLAISLQGVMAIYRDGKDWDSDDRHLGTILKQLPFHSLSDNDLWVALMSGCFVDQNPPWNYPWMEPHIPCWWTADESGQDPSQSVSSVMKEWRTCYDHYYVPYSQHPPVERHELIAMHSKIQSFLSNLDVSAVQIDQHALFIEEGVGRLTDLLNRWNEVAFPGCNTTWNPFSLYRDASSLPINS